MSDKKSFADKARELTQEGLKRKSEEESEKRQKAAQADEELKKRMETKAHELFAEVKTKIVEAANDGRNSISFSIMSASGEQYPAWCRHLSSALRELLEAEDLITKEESGRERALDPDDYSAGYWLNFIISWESKK